MDKPEHPGQPNAIAELHVFLKADWTDAEYQEIVLYLRGKGALAVACDTLLPTDRKFWETVKRAVGAVKDGKGTKMESLQN